MATHDPYEHDPGLRELHERDLRNSATPINKPVVQAVDLAAADDEGRLDETGANADESVEGDAKFAVDSHESVVEQVEQVEDAGTPDDDEPLVDNTSPAGDDEPSPVNAFGNVAPDHAIEQEPGVAPVREDDPETKNFDESDQSFKSTKDDDDADQ